MVNKLLCFRHELNPRRNKVMAAARLAGVAVEDGELDCAAMETEEFRLECSPTQRNPVLLTDEGCVFESNAIVRHLGRLEVAGAGTYGRTPFEATQVDMWLDFATTELDAHAFYFLAACFGCVTKDEATARAKVGGLMEAFTGLEARLAGRTFLVGERPTMADVAVTFGLDTALRFSGADFSAFTRVRRYYDAAWQLPAVQAALKANGHDGQPAGAGA